MLRERLGDRRLRFTNDQRRRLAAKGRLLARRRLEELAGIVTPETLLRWYRELIAKKYDGKARRAVGRPTSAAGVQQLVVRFAAENQSWGYTRIQGGRCATLRHELGRNTIKRIRLDHDIPARRRPAYRSVPRVAAPPRRDGPRGGSFGWEVEDRMATTGVTGIDRLTLDAGAKAILRSLVQSWESHRGVVSFVGAGFSTFQAVAKAGAPPSVKFATWQGLLDQFADALCHGDKDARQTLPTDALRLAALYEKEFGRQPLLELIERNVPDAHFDPGPAHHRLRELPLAAIVTGNYDTLLERAFPREQSLRVIVGDEDLTASTRPGALDFVKIHGELRRRDTIVIAEEDYRVFDSQRPGVALKVKQLLVEYPTLFVGFSLNDPNFVRIDGWIRDTVGKLRLNAVAIVHSPIKRAEAELWKQRGIDLVHAAGVPMHDLLAGLAEEWRNRSPLPVASARLNDRVDALRPQIREAVRAAPHDVQAVARLLGQLVDGAATDGDGGAAVRWEAPWIAWGWRVMLEGDFDHERPHVRPPLLMRLRDVYQALQPVQQVRLLMLVVEAGEFALRFDVGDELDIVAELLKRSLAKDELARLHLFRARAHRQRGETAAAEGAIRDGRVSAVPPGLDEELTIEFREVLFLRSDEAEIRRELGRPCHDSSAAHSRRGSDFLLLGDKETARVWYQQALNRAKNGDERYVALWGLRAAAGAGREFEFNDELLRIRPEDRPAVVALEDHEQRAAQKALEGKDAIEVFRSLHRYLEGLRRIGWPHTASHNAKFPIEIAVEQAARLLLQGERDDGRAVERMKEGLTLLNVYGLAKDVASLFGSDEVSTLARTSADVEWFRTFAAARPTLPRPHDARLTTAIGGIPLLGDAEIESVVEVIAARTERYLDGRDKDDLLAEWWKQLGRHGEHLPASAVRRIVPVAIRCASDRWLAIRLEPQRIGIAFSLWKKAGFLDASIGDNLVELAESAFQAVNIIEEEWSMRTVCSLVQYAVRNDVLSEAEKQRVATAGDALLGRIVDDRAHKAESLAWLLVEIGQPSQQLDRLATHAVALVERELNSSALASTLALLVKLLPAMTDAAKAALFDLVLAKTKGLTDASDGFFDRESIVSSLCALADSCPARRAEGVELVQRLLVQHPERFGQWVEPNVVFPPDADEAAELARVLVTVPAAPRRGRLGVVAKWLRAEPAGPHRDELVDALIALLAADEAETRRAAIDMFRHERADLVAADPVRRPRLVKLLVRLAAKDESWMVRASALFALVDLVRSSTEAATLRDLLADARNSNIALLRRVAEIGLARLPASAPP